MIPKDQMPELGMDADDLYREDIYTDRRIGTIRRLTPVTAEGETDSSRPVLYAGQTQLLTPAGALPLSFEIEAENLAEAVERFASEAEQALERTMEELKEMRRDAASGIVVPGAGGGMDPGAMGGMPGGGGGVPGGGKIRMP